MNALQQIINAAYGVTHIPKASARIRGKNMLARCIDNIIEEYGYITPKLLAADTKMTLQYAGRILFKMHIEGYLEMHVHGTHRRYTLKEQL